MKKTIDIFLILLIFLFVYFLQANFFMWFNIAGIKPNLFIIIIMMIGLAFGRNYGFFCGAIFGLFLDFWISSKIGIYASALSVVGLVSGFFANTFSNNNKLNVIFITTSLTFLYEIVLCAFTIFYSSIKSIEIIELIKIILIEVLYNDIIIIIIYPIFSKFAEKLENDFKNRNFLKFLF